MSLAIRHLKKSYPQIAVFEDFSLTLRENMITCILGPSGIGKTTLLNIITGINPPDSGDISDFSNKTFSYIFQEPRLLKWKTVYENINFVLRDIYPLQKSHEISEKYIDIVGLSEFRHYYPGQISGGMEQRVSIARAFAYPSDILIMDEPFKSLDHKLKKTLMGAFIQLWESDKRTVISVTHDSEEAAYIGNDIFILEESLPARIKKEMSVDIDQKERLSDYNSIRQIKRTLIESL